MRIKPHHSWIAFRLREPANSSHRVRAISLEYKYETVLLLQCCAYSRRHALSDTPQVGHRIAGALCFGQFNPYGLRYGMAPRFQSLDQSVIQECLGVTLLMVLQIRETMVLQSVELEEKAN
jgi:hypothetical protein